MKKQGKHDETLASMCERVAEEIASKRPSKEYIEGLLESIVRHSFIRGGLYVGARFTANPTNKSNNNLRTFS